MDFNIISFRERSYKIVSFAFVVLSLLAVIYWCYKMQFDSTTVFFASIVFAVVLFLVGLFINDSESKTNNLITERAEIYNRLTSVVSRIGFMKDATGNVIRIRVFQEETGRSEDDLFRRKHNGDKAYFDFWGKYKMPLSSDSEKKISDLESDT